jgi:hypothetical protein
VGDADAETLRADLRHALPDYMVPGVFVPLDALPLTPNGKLDAKALPAPERTRAEGYVAPRTAVEATLAEIWAEVLRRERVGVHDDFFAIGGHSLLATRVVSHVRDVLDAEFGVVTLFENPTIHGLARVLDARRSAGAAGLMGERMRVDDPSPQSVLASIDEMSDEELDRLLAANPEAGG